MTRSTPYHWRRTEFKDWRMIAAGAMKRWPDFAQWATLKDKGLRKPSLVFLDRFVQGSHDWSTAEARRFVIWLMRTIYRKGGWLSSLPHPVLEDLVRPTLTSWTSEESANSVPFRWLGWLNYDMDLLRESIRRDDREQIARELFVAIAARYVDYSIHELPYAYVGKAAEDLELLRETRSIVQGIELPELREHSENWSVIGRWLRHTWNTGPEVGRKASRNGLLRTVAPHVVRRTPSRSPETPLQGLARRTKRIGLSCGRSVGGCGFAHADGGVRAERRVSEGS